MFIDYALKYSTFEKMFYKSDLNTFSLPRPLTKLYRKLFRKFYQHSDWFAYLTFLIA